MTCEDARSTRRAAPLATICLLALAIGCGAGATGGSTKSAGPAFPRLGGMNIGEKNYDEASYQRDLARLDVVILGFYKGWSPGGKSIRTAVQEIKARNPAIRIGQYTILNEAYDDPDNDANRDVYDKLYAAGWWLKNAAGDKVQWTSEYDAWEVNFTSAAPRDGAGLRYPEWLAQRDHAAYFAPVPEFDIWYFDNVMLRSRVAADYDRDGQDDDPDDADAQRRFRLGMQAEWTAAGKLSPGLLQMGNPDGDLSQSEYAGRLGGAYLEGMMGESWSLETWSTWQAMMTRYRGVLANTAEPHLVLFDVQGAVDDYQLLRYGLGSCLLDDGYFVYTDAAVGYSSVPWFDEYDVELGAAVDPPPTAAWQAGVYRRRFQKGMVLVNPKGNGSRAVTLDEDGYRRISGTQDRAVNSGAAVARGSTITLPERDAIVLVR